MAPISAVVRALRAHPFASDAALALGLVLFVLQDVLISNGDYLTGQKSVYIPAALLMTVPLAWRRRNPLLVVIVVMAALAAQSLLLTPSAPYPDSELVPLLLAVYSVAAHGQGRAPLVGAVVSFGAGLVWVGVDDFFLPLVAFGGAWLAGRLVQKRQLYAEAMEERTRVLEREREANARIAAAEERVRIARELHDVLSHSISVMVVQAGAERTALGSGRSAPGEALEAIEKTGRQALAEMRRLLGMLRGDGEPPAHAPQPTLEELEHLVSQVREAGLPVELTIEGEPTALPLGVGVSAYRIVQEALTNVLKHAGPASARVVVRYRNRQLELEVADNGRGSLRAGGPGHGLVGMRERVALYGGNLDVGSRNGGGFVVHATLPFAAIES